jgi:hypothetical protein
MATWLGRSIASRSRGGGNALAGVASISTGCQGTSKSRDYPLGRWQSGQTAHRHRVLYTEIIAVVGVALLAFALADAAARSPNFNPDESRWLSRAHYVAALAQPFGPTWTDQYMTRGQPPLGSYAMGIGLLAQGRDLQTNAPWDYSQTWEQNIALGHKPGPADLGAGRRTSAALVALTAVALIGVARVYLSIPWSIGAGALFAIHPFTSYIGSIAMSDALFGLLIALAAWAAASFARCPSWRRAVLIGVLLGLGGATKLSPLAVAAGLSATGVLAFVVPAIRRRHFAPDEAAYAVLGIVIAVVAALTFIASYPYLWPNPIAHTRHLFAFRVEEMAAQSSDWPVMAVPNRVEALRRVNVNFTERYNLSASLIALFGGAKTASMVRQGEFLIPVLGLVLMAGMAVRDGPYSPSASVLAVLGGQVLITILGMRSEFDRYHVPMALLGAVAAAVALEWLVWRAQSLLVVKDRLAPATGNMARGIRRVARIRTNDHVGDDQERLAGAGEPLASGPRRLPADRQIRSPHADRGLGLGAGVPARGMRRWRPGEGRHQPDSAGARERGKTPRSA